MTNSSAAFLPPLVRLGVCLAIALLPFAGNRVRHTAASSDLPGLAAPALLFLEPAKVRSFNSSPQTVIGDGFVLSRQAVLPVERSLFVKQPDFFIASQRERLIQLQKWQLEGG